MCKFIAWCSLEPAAQAAWVQAVGSVAAILIAVAVPVFTAWVNARAERARGKEKMLNAALGIFDPLSSLRVSLDDFYETSAPDYDHDNPVVSIDPHAGDFQSLIPAVIASVGVLDDMGPLAPALRKLLYQLIALDRFLKIIPALQRSGANASWINHRDEVRDQVKDAMDSADLVIKSISDLMEKERDGK